MEVQNTIKNSKQKGFTFYEILIGSVIAALLAAYIVPQLISVKDKNLLVGQEVGLMRSTLVNMEDRYYDEFVDADVDNQQLVDGEIIASAYRTNGNVIYNLFDGPITINGVSDNGLTWLSEGITKTACAKLVDDSKNLGFETVDVGGNVVTYIDAKNVDFTAACIAGLGTSETVDITWTRDAY